MIAWIETRSEGFAKNVENEGRRVTEFLGLAWQAQQASRKESAGANLGWWNHYEEALAPALAQLAPYCRTFGN